MAHGPLVSILAVNRGMSYAVAMNMDNADTGITQKTEDHFRYYIWHIEVEVSKRCVVTQSVYVMQHYPSL